MLHSFSCENFYSFKNKVSIDFTVNGDAPKTEGYFSTPLGVRLSKTQVVVGSNASGKTILLKALPFLQWLITHSFSQDLDAPLPFQSFELDDGSRKKATVMEVVFEIDKIIYSYSVSMTRERIVSEKLEKTEFVTNRKSTKLVFDRMWDEKNKRYKLKNKCGLPDNFESSLRGNVSTISLAIQFNHSESREIGGFWSNVYTNVSEAGWFGDHLVLNSVERFLSVLDLYEKNSGVKEKMEKYLATFDLGLSGVEVRKEKTGSRSVFHAKGIHSLDGKEYSLDLTLESSGTKQFMMMLAVIIRVLENGGIAVIDEFEVNLHPEMVRELFSMFIHPEINPKNAQIIFSTHSHSVLEDLDKYQIVLVEKDESGASDAWRLDTVKGVRSDDNHYMKYVTGVYGAVPRIR
ncbi:MAG: ATP-binding protein [Candidatus Kaiserbacteria bacterium]|nr:ATP-binding protein [Candidatus Kaiserbacteria bacterium]